jgi:hypothetical protein
MLFLRSPCRDPDGYGRPAELFLHSTDGLTNPVAARAERGWRQAGQQTGSKPGDEQQAGESIAAPLFFFSIPTWRPIYNGDI